MVYSGDGESSGNEYVSKRTASSRAKSLGCCSTHWKMPDGRAKSEWPPEKTLTGGLVELRV